MRVRDWLILGALLIVTVNIAAYLYVAELTSLLEAISFVTGVLCVWLTVKESLWNFPLSLLNVLAFSFVFFKARLFADAGLQVVYFVLTLHGWYMWLFGGEDHTSLRISRAPKTELLAVIVSGIGVAAILRFVLERVGGSASFLDATTTAISLCAQYLLNRKYLESWYFWILVDLIYLPLYIDRQLNLTAILYAIFLVMAIMGLVQWRAKMLKQNVRGFEVVMS